MYDFVYFHTFFSAVLLSSSFLRIIRYIVCMKMDKNEEGGLFYVYSIVLGKSLVIVHFPLCRHNRHVSTRHKCTIKMINSQTLDLVGFGYFVYFL